MLVTFWRARLRVVPIAVGLLAAELLVAGAAHRYPFLEERTSIFSPRCSLSVGRGGRRGGAWSVRCPLTIPLGITMVVAAVGLLVPAARAGALHPLPTSTVRQQVAHVLAHRHPGGDWNPPGSARPPEKSWITATAYYYLAADLLAKTAKVLGRPAEAAKYARLRDRIRKAFIERFFDPRTNTFVTPTPAGYRQISNAIPLAFGLVPEDRREAVAAKLAANVRGPSRGHLNTGMFGFETFTVRPGLFGDLKEVRASTETVRGRITVHWRMGPGGACSSTGPCRGTAQRRSIWRRGRSPPSPRAGTPSAEPRAFVSSGPRTARPSCRSAPAATGSMSQDGGRPAPASVAGGGPRRSCRGSARCHRRWGRRPGCRGAAGRGRPGGRSA